MLLTTLAAWDATACRTLNRTNHRWVGAGFRGISRLGNGGFWYALIAALPLVHGVGALRTSVTMLLGGAASTLLYRGIKLSTRRLRPCEAQPRLHLTELPLDRFSFPSGHTLHAVCFSTIACAAYPAWAVALWTFTAWLPPRGWCWASTIRRRGLRRGLGFAVAPPPSSSPVEPGRVRRP
jgi:undecaprenyl-diphosphatase